MLPLPQLICAHCPVWSLDVGLEGIESYGYGGDQGNDSEGGEEDSFDEADEECNYDEEEGGSYGRVGSDCCEGCEHYPIQFDAESSLLGMIDLNAEWRKAQPARLDFVEVDRDGKGLVYAILVEWKDGIAYRVQRPVEPLELRVFNSDMHSDQRRDVLVMFG